MGRVDMDASVPDKDRNFVTALARGLDVLRAYRAGETTLSNADFAQRTGLPKPTVSRLTHTLCCLGYLVADPQTGGYRLGAGVLELGYGVLSSLEIGTRAASVMKALVDGPNSYITCALAERHGHDAVYVAVQHSVEDVSLTMHVGARLPLFRSAIGQAILVAMDASTRDDVLASAARRDPDGAEQRAARIDAARAELASKHYITGFGMWRADVNGIATPIRSLDGRRIFALNVGGPAFHVPPEELETVYAPRLLEAARQLGSGRT